MRGIKKFFAHLWSPNKAPVELRAKVNDALYRATLVLAVPLLILPFAHRVCTGALGISPSLH